MWETHLDKSMIHTQKLTTLDREITPTLDGKINKTKGKIRDAPTSIPTTMLLIKTPHRDTINIHLTNLLNHLILTLHQSPRRGSQKLRLYLKAYARTFKIAKLSRKKCNPTCRIKMLPSKNWKHRLNSYSSKPLGTTIAAILTQYQGKNVRPSPSEVGRN